MTRGQEFFMTPKQKEDEMMLMLVIGQGSNAVAWKSKCKKLKLNKEELCKHRTRVRKNVQMMRLMRHYTGNAIRNSTGYIKGTSKKHHKEISTKIDNFSVTFERKLIIAPQEVWNGIMRETIYLT